MACLPQLGSVPAAHAVVAGGCDWPLPPAGGLYNNDVFALPPLREFRQLRYVRYVPCVACFALPAPGERGISVRSLPRAYKFV